MGYMGWIIVKGDHVIIATSVHIGMCFVGGAKTMGQHRAKDVDAKFVE